MDDKSKYAHRFDFEVMHHYQLKSFLPFFVKGRALELGAHRGDFTQRLLPHFSSITCVDSAVESLDSAKQQLGNKVEFVPATFEKAKLAGKFENIFLMHVLEHVSDPVALLQRINGEWLAPGGRLFLTCPNANAASRQIAVKMGLISHCSAVTDAEREHGHHVTYSLDTLERVATQSGLRVVHRSGVFFKAFANFQWDRLLQTDIISPAYLDGCYALGQEYPDLCASIFLLCEQGTP